LFYSAKKSDNRSSRLSTGKITQEMPVQDHDKDQPAAADLPTNPTRRRIFQAAAG
jgi:hypothetical protein